MNTLLQPGLRMLEKRSLHLRQPQHKVPRFPANLREATVRALAFETVTALLFSAPASSADLLIVVNKSDDTVSILDAKSGVVRARIDPAPTGA